ncbi:hypothetical protein BsWGS_15970 [Bradybaena similaris]
MVEVKSERTLDYLISLTRAFFTYYYYIYMLLLIFVLVTLSVVGGLVFQIVESPPEAKIIDAIMRQRDSTIRQLQQKVKAKESKQEITLFIQLYEGHYIGAIRNGTVILNGKEEPLWTFGGSVYYCVTTFSLVGYGNLAPRTSLGRAIAIIYCGFTIPVNSLILAEMGEMLLLAFEYIWMKLHLRREPDKSSKDITALKNTNRSACSCYQVTFRCSGDIAAAKCHNSDPTRLRSRRDYSDGCTAQGTHNWICCTAQGTHNWICCGPSQQVVESVSAVCDRHSEGVLTDVAENQLQHTAAGMDNPIAAMNILELTKTQEHLWDCVMNDCVETSNFMYGNFSIDVFGDPSCESAIVGASDGFGFSSLNDLFDVYLDSLMMGKYNSPDFYSKNDINDVLDGSAVAETDASSCDCVMIEPRVALCEPSMHVPDNFLHGPSVNVPKVTLCDLTLSESAEANDDFAIDSFDNALCDFTIDSPGENLSYYFVNDEENFTDEHNIILCRSPCRLPQFQTEDSAQCAHKRDQRLSRCVRRSYSAYSLRFVTETSNRHQNEPVPVIRSCHCSQTNSHFVSADCDYTLTQSKDEEGSTDGSGVPSSGIIFVKKPQHSKTDDIIRRGPVAEHAGLKHIRSLIEVPEERLNEDDPGDALAGLVLSPLHGCGTEILDIQVHIPVGILSLVGRWELNNIHHTKLPGTGFVKEINAAGTYQNYFSEIWQVGVQQYPVVLFIDQAWFSSSNGNIHGGAERRLVVDRLWRNTGAKGGLDKVGMAPEILFNHRGQFNKQTKGGAFLDAYKSSEDKHTFLGNINQPSLGQAQAQMLVSRLPQCGRTYFVSFLCPTLVLPKRSAPYLLRCHYDYLQNSTIVLSNSTIVLPNSTTVLLQNTRATSVTEHAIIPKNTRFETDSICRECLLYVETNHAGKDSHSGIQHRGCHPRLADAAIETDINKHCASECRKTLPTLKILQPAHSQRRCDRPKSACRDKLSSRLCTQIKRATEKPLTRATPCPGAVSVLSAVAKMVLKKRVKKPRLSAMFWLGTPLRSLYIGKRVGNGIRAQFSHAKVAHQLSNGSSMSKRKSKTSKHTHISRDRNNNVKSSDDDDDDDEDEDDDDKSTNEEEPKDGGHKVTSEPVLLTIATTFVFISMGATVLTKLADNMTYFDSYWFIWISVATIGYGDIVPTEQRLFLYILAYIFIGLCLMSNLISETSLFFSSNVSKTRSITSDAVAIINTRKQLIVIQRRSERANNHWAILREKVMNKQIPHHLVEEANKYKAGLLIEEREMVRFAYKAYFKQTAPKYQPPVQDNAMSLAPGVLADMGQGEIHDIYTDEARDSIPDDQSILLSEAAPEVVHPEPDVRQGRKPSVWQRTKKAIANTFSGTHKNG